MLGDQPMSHVAFCSILPDGVCPEMAKYCRVATSSPIASTRKTLALNRISVAFFKWLGGGSQDLDKIISPLKLSIRS